MVLNSSLLVSAAGAFWLRAGHQFPMINLQLEIITSLVHEAGGLFWPRMSGIDGL